MNILIVHNNEIRPTFGGISRISYSLSQMFERKGLSVWFLAQKKMVDSVCLDNQIFLPSSDLSDSVNYDYLINSIEKYKIEYVVNQACYNVPFLLLLRKVLKAKPGTKLITCLHNSVLTPVKNFAYTKEYYLRKHKLSLLFCIFKNNFFKKAIVELYIIKKRKLYDTIVLNSDIVTVLSEGQKKELLRTIDKKGSTNVVIIPNTIGQIPSIPEEKKDNIVLWVGTFDMQIKRPDLMLRIWNNIYEHCMGWKLLMLGDGPDFDEAQNLAKRLGVKNVFFEGRVNPIEYYKKAKIICITSIHESFSLVTVEGMSNAVSPIIFNSFFSASEIVTSRKNGILINPFDVERFSQELENLIHSPLVLKKMQENSYESSKKYSEDNIYNYWSEVLQ